MRITPMRKPRIPDPFDADEFIFEPKIDGQTAYERLLAKTSPALSPKS